MTRSGEEIRMLLQDGDGEAVKALLDEVGSEEVYERIKEESPESDYHHSSLLQYVVHHSSNLEGVRAVLSSLGSQKEKVRAITEDAPISIPDSVYGEIDSLSAVHIAIKKGRVDILNLLLDTLGDGHNMLPHLHWFAAEFGTSFEVFKRVCDFHDDAGNQEILAAPNGPLAWFDSKKMTPEEKGWLAGKVEKVLDHFGDDSVACMNFIIYTYSLHHAALGEHEEIITLLLNRLGEFGIPYAVSQKYDAKFFRDMRDETPLHIAAESGNINIFKLLLDKVNDDEKAAAMLEKTSMGDVQRTRGSTVAHFAAGCTDILKMAIEQLSGSEAAQAVILQYNDVKPRPRSVLQLTVWKRNRTGVEFLLGKFDDLEKARQAISTEDSEGRNLLLLAVERGAIDIFQTLAAILGPNRSRKMLIENTTTDGDTVLHLVRDPLLLGPIQLAVSSPFLFKGLLLTKINKRGETPFHTSEFFKKLVACSKMTSKEVESELTGSKDRVGRTPLHMALKYRRLDVFMDMVESAESAAGCFQVADEDGVTVLHHYLLTCSGDSKWESNLKYIREKVGIEQLRILLKQTAKKNETLLHAAAKNSGTQFHDLLDVCGISTSVEEIKGILGGGAGHEHRALHVACELGNKFLVRFLLDNGCTGDIMKHDELFLGNTALHAAAIGDPTVQIIKLLLDSLGSRFDMNECVNWCGQTPLHFAMASDNEQLVKYLIEETGANPAQSDHAGATCAHFGARSQSLGTFHTCAWILKASVDSVNLLTKATEAGMTPLHYQAWNLRSCSGSFVSNCVNSLDVVDGVERLTPFLWSAKARLNRRYLFTDDYLSENKNPLSGFSATHLLSHDFCHDAMELMCKDMITRQPEVVVTNVLVACTLVYGDIKTNQQLAKKLLDSHDSSTLADLLLKSKGLHLAAKRGTPDFKRKATLAAFLEAITKGDGSKGRTTDIISKLQVQLESAFKEALVNNAEDGFLQVLIKYMQPFRVRELLQTRLCQVTGSFASFKQEYDSRSSAEKSKMTDVDKMVEDIPLAYWITLAQLKKQDRSPGQGGDSQENMVKVEYETTLSLVRRMVHDADADAWGDAKVESEYPNGLGRYTRRTALHWAVILGRKDIVSQLTMDTRCRKDLVDDFGKQAYWYALIHKDKLNFGVKQGYMTFIDLLKWDKYYDSLYKDRGMYVEGLNAILVGAALIATVAFTGLVTPPLQYPVKSSPSTPDVKFVAVYMPEVQVFWVANSMSFFLSMTSSLACVTGILPNPSAFDLLEVERIRRVVVWAATFLVLSIFFILIAFVSAGFSVLPKTVNLQANMIVTTIIGGAFCVFRLGSFGKIIYLLNPNNQLQRVIWWLKSKFPSFGLTSTRAAVEEVEAEAVPERPTYKRGSIHEHIISSGGFSNGPYDWDDGLWEPPFAVRRKPAETSRDDVAIAVDEAGPSCVV